MKGKGKGLLLGAWGLNALAAGSFLLLRRNPGAVEAVLEDFSIPLREVLGRLTSSIPFSVAELCYTLLILGAVVLLIFLVKDLLAKKPWKQRAGKALTRLAGILLIPALMWNSYSWLWALGYYGPSFAQRSGLDSGGISTQALRDCCALFAQKANELSTQQLRDEEGSLVETDYFQQTAGLYEKLESLYPQLAGPELRPKGMFYSKFMSLIGFTGFYFPLTGEANVNMDFPTALRPATVCHELAHQRRVVAEDEANFVGIAAAITSGDKLYEYSGYLLGLIQLGNALYEAEPEAWLELSASLSPQVRQDWREDGAYWERWESPVETVATGVYDGYLKHNDQSDGIRSYGKCVNLLVREQAKLQALAQEGE